MSHYLVERIKTIPNITVEPYTEVIEVHGDERLTGLTIRHHDTKTTEERPAGAVFIFIGAEPQTEWLEGKVCRDGKGFLVTGRNLLRDGKRPAGWTPGRDPSLLETSVPGVFAIGDVRSGSVKRVGGAIGEGAAAVAQIHAFLARQAAATAPA